MNARVAAGSTAPGPLRLEAVRDRAGLKQFFRMPAPLYAGDPHWVPQLMLERLEHLDPTKNAFLAGIEIEKWLAFRGSRCVGRVTAQINQGHLALHKDGTGHFGFLEAEDNPEVFGLLMGTAEAWLRQRGMERIAGPFNPSINDECGLLVDGFDTPPAVMMGHTRPYYPARLEALGYRPLRSLLAYDFDVQADWPPAAARLLERLRRNRSIAVRPIDMRRYDAEIRTFVDIFNDGWLGNWGFVPFTDEEGRYLAKSLKLLVDKDSFAVGEVDGMPAAMVVVLPDLNEAIRDLDGRLFPFGILKLLWRLKVKGTRGARMPLMGIRRQFHGTARGAALALAVIAHIRDAYRARGVQRAELSWILEDNRPIRDVIELVGGRVYKTYRIYGRELA